MVKNTTPLFLRKNDSVKNKLIIRIEKAKCTKSFILNAFFTLINSIITSYKNRILPNLQNSEHIGCGNSSFGIHHWNHHPDIHNKPLL